MKFWKRSKEKTITAAVEDEPDRHAIRTLSRESILPYITTILLVGAGFLVFIVYRSYAWPVFLAVLFYAGFENLNRLLVRLFRGRRTPAAVLSTILVIIVVLGPSAFLIQYLVFEAIDLVFRLKEYVSGEKILLLAHSLPVATDIITSEPFFWVDLVGTVQTFMGEYASYLDPDKFGSWISNAYSFMTDTLQFTIKLAANLLLGLILLFFLFRDGHNFYSFMERALPFPAVITRSFVDRMKEIISAVLRGNIFVSVLQGAAVGFGLFMTGIDNPVLYGSIAGIFSLIPIVGTMVVWLPASLFLAFVEISYKKGILLGVYCLGMYLFLENILKPKLLDKKLGMHSLFLFLAIIGGIQEFGITGVVLGPLFVTLFLTIWSIYHIWDAEDESK